MREAGSKPWRATAVHWWRAAHQRDHTADFAAFDEDPAEAGVAGAARLPGRVGVGLFDGSSVLDAIIASSSVISFVSRPKRLVHAAS